MPRDLHFANVRGKSLAFVVGVRDPPGRFGCFQDGSHPLQSWKHLEKVSIVPAPDWRMYRPTRKLSPKDQDSHHTLRPAPSRVDRRPLDPSALD